jgi:hypothetical protein
MDRVGVALAGLKIAYEFTFDTRCDAYLADPAAERARDFIITGIPRLDAPNRGSLDTMGGVAFPGPDRFFPWRELERSTHVLGLKAHGNQVQVLMRLFNIYEGMFTMSHDASAYLDDGCGRIHMIDVVSKARWDYRLGPKGSIIHAPTVTREL